MNFVLQVTLSLHNYMHVSFQLKTSENALREAFKGVRHTWT